MAIIVGTDGLCKNNQATGGQKGTWAFAVFIDGVYKGGKSGNNPSTTNNEMELTAILEALNWAKRHNIQAMIHTDSQYAINCVYKWSANWIKNGWMNSKKEPVANQNLIKAILNNIGSCNIRWVKGHAGVEENEMADHLCNQEYLNVFI